MSAQAIEAQTARIDRTLTETYYQRRGMSGRMGSNSDYLEGWSDVTRTGNHNSRP